MSNPDKPEIPKTQIPNPKCEYDLKQECFNSDGLVKSPNSVTPAKAGVQKLLK
jgi:hypothetical protein